MRERSRAAPPRAPGALALTWRQYRLERAMFWRNPSAAFFNFLLPLLFLAAGGAILRGQPARAQPARPLDRRMSVMSTTFTALAYNIVFLRERGRAQAHARHAAADDLLLRRRGGQRGDQHGDADRDHRARRSRCCSGSAGRATGRELIVFVVGGVVCFASLGVAFAHVIPNFESTAAYVNAVFLPVVFLSFYVFDSKSAPAFLSNIAHALPLTPLIEGLSGAMVTGSSLAASLDALAVIGLWSVFGIYFAVRGFSWEQRRG